MGEREPRRGSNLIRSYCKRFSFARKNQGMGRLCQGRIAEAFHQHYLLCNRGSPMNSAGLQQEQQSTIPQGPAGRAMAQPMGSDLLRCLQEHLTMERQASAAYWALAIWFAERELRGFAQFCKQEASSEQHHAGLFADYLIARGQTVSLETLEGPRQSWSGIEEIFCGIFQMESEVTTSLQQLYALAERSGDVRTTVFLDPLVQSQIDAENQTAHLLGRIRFAQSDRAALLVIDGELSAGNSQPSSVA